MRKLDKKHDKSCEFVVPQIVKITLNKTIIDCINTTIKKDGEDLTVSSLIAQINALISRMACLKSSLPADTNAVYRRSQCANHILLFKDVQTWRVLNSKEEEEKKNTNPSSFRPGFKENV